jgi:4-amino-4-deoxy-L-arabinose transferase-like glycosyltransferase
MPRLSRDHALLAAIAFATAVFHIVTAPGYGVFRDELYYLACGEHLDWGYVDHPPLIALIAAGGRALLGASTTAIRVLPALAAGATVFVAGSIARELGGGRFAQVLAATATALSPIYLAVFSLLSMNAFDVLVWSLAFWLFARLLGDQPRPRDWLVLGALLGVGLENKISILYLGVGLGAGLLDRRALLRTRGPWLAAVLAIALFVPHLAWQVAHHWPTLEFIANARTHKMVALSPLAFVVAQLTDGGPTTPLWLAGLAFLFTAPARRWRPIAIAYLAMLAVLAASHAKPYYLAPAYTALLAAGAVAIERVTPVARAVAVVLVLACVALAPLAKPLLPVDTYVAYRDSLGLAPSTDEHHALGRLPQHFADMQGWHELADTVARVHATLPATTCVYANNYGEAGAIDLYTSIHTIAGHNSYYLWGPGECTADPLIIVGVARAELEPLFDTITLAATHHCADCMPYEASLPIWIVRGARAAMPAIWPRTRSFI